MGDGVTAADFAANAIPAGNVTFANGQTSVTLNIKVKGDNTKELAETFSVILTDPLGQTQLLDAAGNAASSLSRGFVIANDDPLIPTFTLPSTLDLVAEVRPRQSVVCRLTITTQRPTLLSQSKLLRALP